MKYTKKNTKKSYLNIFFYFKLIGIVIFSTFDIVITAIIFIYEQIKGYIKGTGFEDYINKYLKIKHNKRKENISVLSKDTAIDTDINVDSKEPHLSKEQKKIFQQAFTWMKLSAETPESKRKYKRSVEKLIKINNISWVWVKKEYDRYISKHIKMMAKPFSKKNLKEKSVKKLITYYQEPTKNNFIYLCNHIKKLNKDSFKAILDLLHIMDSRLWAQVASELN